MNNIREALKAKGMTQEQVAKHLGVSRQAVQRWCAGHPPTVENLGQLATVLGVTVGYLSGAESARDVRPVQDMSEPAGEEFVRIPVLDVSAACAGDVVRQHDGHAKIVSAVDFYRPFLRQQNGVTSLSHMEIINTVGDSMEPTISRNSFVLVDKNQSRLFSDGIYCLNIDGSIYVKRVQRRPDGSIKVISDNARYESFNVEPQDFERTVVIGRVVYVFNGSPL